MITQRNATFSLGRRKSKSFGSNDDWVHVHVKMSPRPLSQERASEFDDVAETLKEQLQEARNCAEEDHTVKRLDSLLNHVLFGVSSWIFLPEYSYILGFNRGWLSHS
jgi:hypothetical protein